MTERKPFDAAVRRLLDAQAAAAAALPPATGNEARVRTARALMLRAVQERARMAGLPNAVATRDVAIAPGLGAVATVDPFCRLLAEAARVIVVSVEYRLAPEHPYPAALDDARAALDWVRAHASGFGADASRLALGGDSAGANLAAVTANRLCAREGARALQAQLLLYPVTDHPRAGHASYEENARGYGLEAETMRWFWQQYAPTGTPGDPDLAPLRRADVPPLPPTLVTTAHYDVLRDEGIAYADRLKRAGVAVTHFHAPDMGHNFPVTPSQVARFPQCVETLAQIAGWLGATLGVSR